MNDKLCALLSEISQAVMSEVKKPLYSNLTGKALCAISATQAQIEYKKAFLLPSSKD